MAQAGLRSVGRTAYGSWSESWGREFTARLLASHPRVDGIFCGSDQIARGVADALRQAGRRMPEDVAVVGFDNWDVMALATQPPLSSIDMNMHLVGRLSADFLMSAISGKPARGLTKVACRLVVRQSSYIVAEPEAAADSSVAAEA